jgi:hypothetical protein
MRIVKNILLLVIVLILSGCSVFMAAKQPDKKDLSLMTVGMPRNILVAEFGKPIALSEKDGKKVEIFKFIDGYSSGAKVGRAILHGSADVLTLGTWELIGTPTEGVYDGDEMVYQVSYNTENIVTEVIPLKK